MRTFSRMTAIGVSAVGVGLFGASSGLGWVATLGLSFVVTAFIGAIFDATEVRK